jgi:hypothetical protein
MRPDFTDITVVMDRSGSMQACRADTEGGFNSFVESQKKLPGSANLTLVQFDTEYDFVHRGVPIQNVPPFTLVPRGNTALLDAVGRAIVETGERLAALPEADRPGLVTFVIVTDGQENSSREFNLAQIREKITHQRDVYKWQFTFLGANSDAFADAGEMGIPMAATAQYAAHKAQQAFDGASANVRRQRMAAALLQDVENKYFADEARAMSD